MLFVVEITADCLGVGVLLLGGFFFSELEDFLAVGRRDELLLRAEDGLIRGSKFVW